MEVPGGSSITVTATALKGSNVTASLGGTKVKLKQQSNFVQDENGTKLDENSDFAVYSGKISIPRARQSAVARKNKSIRKLQRTLRHNERRERQRQRGHSDSRADPDPARYHRASVNR